MEESIVPVTKAELNPSWLSAIDRAMHTAIMNDNHEPVEEESDDDGDAKSDAGATDADANAHEKASAGGKASAKANVSAGAKANTSTNAGAKAKATYSESESDDEDDSDGAQTPVSGPRRTMPKYRQLDDDDDDDDDGSIESDVVSSDEDDTPRRPPSRPTMRRPVPPPPSRKAPTRRSSSSVSSAASSASSSSSSMASVRPHKNRAAPPRDDDSSSSAPSSRSSRRRKNDDVGVRRRLEETQRLQREEKLDLLGRLQYFIDEKAFKPFKFLGPEDTLEDIRYEYFRAQREINKKKSVKYMQKALITTAAGVEMMNTYYNPLKLKLDGFSKSLLMSLREYDEIFEELHWKYCDAVSMPPELKLIMTMGSSMWFFHMSNMTGVSTNGGGPAPAAAYSHQHQQQQYHPQHQQQFHPQPPPPTQSGPSTGGPSQPKMQGPRSRAATKTASIPIFGKGPSFNAAPAAPGGMNMNMNMTDLLSGLGMVQTLLSATSVPQL